jgi:hypothetical protein
LIMHRGSMEVHRPVATGRGPVVERELS